MVKPPQEARGKYNDSRCMGLCPHKSINYPLNIQHVNYHIPYLYIWTYMLHIICRVSRGSKHTIKMHVNMFTVTTEAPVSLDKILNIKKLGKNTMIISILQHTLTISCTIRDGWMMHCIIKTMMLLINRHLQHITDL